MKPDPIGEPRNPLAVFLLTLSAISGLLLVVGVPSAGSIESQLPRAASLTWGGVLGSGSMAALLGMFWQGDRRTGLVLKRLGFLGLVVASVVYAATLLLFFGVHSLFVSTIVAGYGYACGLQYTRVSRTIHRIIAETDR